MKVQATGSQRDARPPVSFLWHIPVRVQIGHFVLTFCSSFLPSQNVSRFFRTLCRDDTPMVRRAAVGKLGALAVVVEKTVIVQDLVPLFNTLIEDEQAMPIMA